MKKELLEIVRLGHPTLREVAVDIDTKMFGGQWLANFKGQLIEAMLDAKGVGLAAPQVAEGLRCFSYFVPGDEEGVLEVEPRVICNPEIFPVGLDRVLGWEGCLSIPGMRGLVPRFESILVKAYDVVGEKVEFEASGFHARVIQHEYDHLDGVIFLDRMEDLETLCFEEEWEKYMLAEASSEFDEDEFEGELEELS